MPFAPPWWSNFSGEFLRTGQHLKYKSLPWDRIILPKPPHPSYSLRDTDWAQLVSPLYFSMKLEPILELIVPIDFPLLLGAERDLLPLASIQTKSSAIQALVAAWGVYMPLWRRKTPQKASWDVLPHFAWKAELDAVRLPYNCHFDWV